MFRYIVKNEQVTCFDPYFDYIAGLHGKIDEGLYAFVADPGATISARRIRCTMHGCAV